MHTIKAAYKRKKKIGVICESDGNIYAKETMNASQLNDFKELLLFASEKSSDEEFRQLELADVLIN